MVGDEEEIEDEIFDEIVEEDGEEISSCLLYTSYSGKMTQERVTPATGGGSVPRDLALAAGLACDNLYVKGYEGNAASVALTWYRASPQGPSPTDANFGRNTGPVFSLSLIHISST